METDLLGLHPLNTLNKVLKYQFTSLGFYCCKEPKQIFIFEVLLNGGLWALEWTAWETKALLKQSSCTKEQCIYMSNYESGPYLSCKSVTSAGAGDLKSENRPALLAPEGRRSTELLPPGTIQLCTLIFWPQWSGDCPSKYEIHMH